jgi:hypothetical protein
MSDESSSHRWEQLPPGMTINPQSGYPFPARPSEAWRHALAIMNTGEIEDVLGLSTSEGFDPNRIWVSKGGGQNHYFDVIADAGRLAAGVGTVGVFCALVWFGVSP